MKYLIIGILICLIGNDVAKAQSVTYKKGEPFKMKRANNISKALKQPLQYIGKTGRFILYQLGEVGFTQDECILKVDAVTLNVTDVIKIKDMKFTGFIESYIMIGDSLVMVTYSREKNKRNEIIAVNACFFDVNDLLQPPRVKILAQYEGDKKPYVYIGKSSVSIYFVDKTLLYDLKLENVHEAIYKEESNPIVINLKDLNVKRSYSSEIEDKYPEKQIFSYPFNYNNKSARYYIKAPFIPDSSSVITKGHIGYIEINVYDTVKNVKLETYEFKLRPGSRILDFECHEMNDGNFLIFGTYQDKTAKGDNIKIGWFSQIVTPQLSEVAETNYIQIMDQPEAKYDSDYFMIYDSWYSFKPYNALEISSGNHYFLGCQLYRHHNNSVKRIRCVVSIDKKSGIMEYKMLYRNYEDYNGIDVGSLEFNLNDSSLMLLFNDLISNLTYSADDTNIANCGDDPSKACFAWVIYGAHGFSKRNMAVDYAGDGFSIAVDYKGYAIMPQEDKGTFEIICPAFDSERKNCRFYRIIVKS